MSKPLSFSLSLKHTHTHTHSHTHTHTHTHSHTHTQPLSITHSFSLFLSISFALHSLLFSFMPWVLPKATFYLSISVRLKNVLFFQCLCLLKSIAYFYIVPFLTFCWVVCSLLLFSSLFLFILVFLCLFMPKSTELLKLFFLMLALVEGHLFWPHLWSIFQSSTPKLQITSFHMLDLCGQLPCTASVLHLYYTCLYYLMLSPLLTISPQHRIKRHW